MENVSAVRLKLIEIISKADSDPEFHKKLKANPAGVLREFGVPDNAVELVSRANAERLSAAGLTAGSDPTGCIHTNGCSDFTCFSSNCPNSCFVTIVTEPADA